MYLRPGARSATSQERSTPPEHRPTGTGEKKIGPHPTSRASLFAAACLEHGAQGYVAALRDEGALGMLTQPCPMEYTLRHLAAALRFSLPSLFLEHVAWQAHALQARGGQPSKFHAELERVAVVLDARLPSTAAEPVQQHLREALQLIRDRMEGDVDVGCPQLHHPLARALYASAQSGDAHGAVKLVNAAILSSRIKIDRLFSDVLVPVMRQVGHEWMVGDIDSASERACTNTVLAVMDGLPRPEANGLRVAGVTAPGDQHSVGLDLVLCRLELAGWCANRAVVERPIAEFVEQLSRDGVDVVVLAVHVAGYLRSGQKLVAQMRRAGCTIPVLAGGRPLTRFPGLGNALGVDAVGVSIGSALTEAERLVQGSCA